jgi:hypothetical protein
MADFDARLGWYSIGDALTIIGPVAGPSAWQEMKSAIRHKALPTRCLADGVTRDFEPHWLDFLTWDEPEGDVLWFDRDKARRKDVFVPNRAERIVVAAAELNRLWPSTAGGMSERTHQPLYDLVALASAQHGLPREQLLVRAFRAIVENELRVDIDTGLDERLGQGPTPRELIASSIRAIEGDPHFFAHWFKQIVVLRSDFDRWFRGTRDPSSLLLSEHQFQLTPDAEIRPASASTVTCFISYSAKDKTFADRLHADLQNRGVRCWFAPHDLPIGAKTWDAIDEAIRLRDKLLLILSKASIASEWVEDEVNKAYAEERSRKETVLFPIRIDNAAMTTDEPWAVKLRDQRNIGDFRRWKKSAEYQKSLDRLLRDLETHSHLETHSRLSLR